MNIIEQIKIIPDDAQLRIAEGHQALVSIEASDLKLLADRYEKYESALKEYLNSKWSHDDNRWRIADKVLHPEEWEAIAEERLKEGLWD